MTTILFAFGMIFLVPQLFLIGLWTMGNATGCGLILADSNGGEILREAPEHRMAAATRRAVLMRFAHAAAHRLHRLSDPEVLLALMYAILVPPGAVLLFVAIMAFESDYTHLTREAFFGVGGASAQTATLGFQISGSEH